MMSQRALLQHGAALDPEQGIRAVVCVKRNQIPLFLRHFHVFPLFVDAINSDEFIGISHVQDRQVSRLGKVVCALTNMEEKYDLAGQD